MIAMLVDAVGVDRLTHGRFERVGPLEEGIILRFRTPGRAKGRQQ